MKTTLKQSSNIYRIINGITYIQETSNPALFDECIKECKNNGLNYRIVKGEFLREVKQPNEQINK